MINFVRNFNGLKTLTEIGLKTFTISFLFLFLPTPFVNFVFLKTQFFGDSLYVSFIPDLIFTLFEMLFIFFLKKLDLTYIHPLSRYLPQNSSMRVPQLHSDDSIKLSVDTL